MQDFSGERSPKWLGVRFSRVGMKCYYWAKPLENAKFPPNFFNFRAGLWENKEYNIRTGYNGVAACT